MIPQQQAFYPTRLVPVLAATVASAEVALPSRNVVENQQLQIGNASTAWAFVKQGFASGTVAVANVDYAVAPGSVVAITINQNTTHIAAVLSAGAGNIYMTLGGGL
jgi:hypothetical protein